MYPWLKYYYNGFNINIKYDLLTELTPNIDEEDSNFAITRRGPAKSWIKGIY